MAQLTLSDIYMAKLRIKNFSQITPCEVSCLQLCFDNGNFVNKPNLKKNPLLYIFVCFYTNLYVVIPKQVSSLT